MDYRKVLILGGMHGNEKLGIELARLLKQKPLDGVDALIANPRAADKNVRFTETDLNRSFAPSSSETYEQQRAAELRKIVSSYDIVLDFHNTQTPENNCTFVGPGCNPLLYQAAKALELRRCIEATYDCINKFCPNVISIEISKGDEKDSADYWYEKLEHLCFSDLRLNPGGMPLEVYRYRKRVTWQQKKYLNTKTWRPFKPLGKNVTRTLGLNGIIVPIFIGSKLTEYYATLLSKERIM